MPLTIPHWSIGPLNMPIAVGSALVELFDSSDSIDDLLIKSTVTLAGGRLRSARKQEKKSWERLRNWR